MMQPNPPLRLEPANGVLDITPRLEFVRPEPAEYFFNESDGVKYSKRHLRFPVRLAHDPTWCGLWRLTGKRGGGGAGSLLPLLALHAYPGAIVPGTPDALPKPDDRWTPWASLSIRRKATLTGISKGKVERSERDLQNLGWLQTRTLVNKNSGGRKTWFRLSKRLFPEPDEPFALIRGSLIYRGTWMLLPTAASRFLYLTLAALDPVHDEEALKGTFEGEWNITEPDELTEKVQALREAESMSRARLRELTALSPAALDEALSILITPIFGDRNTIPLVRCGGKGNRSRWYAIDKRAQVWYFQTDALNVSPKELEALRRQQWPAYAVRKESQKRRSNRRVYRRRNSLMVGT